MLGRRNAVRLPSADIQRRRDRSTVVVAHVVLVAILLFVFQIMRIYGPAMGASVAVLLAVLGVALVRPDVALGIVIALSIVGDSRAMPWWPVVKNLSAAESSLFFSHGAVVSPLELILATVLAVWWLRRRLDHRANRPVIYGPFWRPMLVFAASIAFGLAWGMARGGNFRVAAFEVRPLVYFILVYFAATNLFTSLHAYHRLLWGLVIALSAESLHGLYRLSDVKESAVVENSSPIEHTAALHMNILLLLLIALLWFGTTRIGKRLLLLLAAIPTIVLYLEAERRSAVVGLVLGTLFLSIVLYVRDRRKFRLIVPAVTLIGLAYVGAFWNAETSQVGFPAQAVKIIVQPDAASEADANSNLYRDIENLNLWTTMRSQPITGIGFGKEFLKPVPLPDISFFEFWAFIPHNSILWLWTQVGLVGFLAFVYMVGLAVVIGLRTIRNIRDPDDAALVSVMTAYVVMTFVVAYVEITFDAQTTVLLGAAFALVGSAHRLVPESAGDPGSHEADSGSRGHQPGPRRSPLPTAPW